MPTLLVGAGALLALLLVEAEVLWDNDLARDWPRLFGAGADGARAMLTAIATSVATVAGVVFSITIVALSLAASQYSPRVLRNFMSDRPTQIVLGSFLAIFTYCLIVLRTIRADENHPFVPTIAVFAGVLTALLGVGLLIYFIHHVAVAIQAPYVIGRITQDTQKAVELMFPATVGEAPSRADPTPPDTSSRAGPARLCADIDAYLVAVDGDGLLEEAARQDAVLKVLPRVGDFVHRGDVLIEAFDMDLDGATQGRLRGCFNWGGERDVHQDVQYGLQQLADVALKALSPSTHDPTTAVLCVDHLGSILRRLSARESVAAWREKDGQPRVYLRYHDFDELVETALGAVTAPCQHARPRARPAHGGSVHGGRDDPGRGPQGSAGRAAAGASGPSGRLESAQDPAEALVLTRGRPLGLACPWDAQGPGRCQVITLISSTSVRLPRRAPAASCMLPVRVR